MLHSMQQATEPGLSGTAGSFAGLLAALTAPKASAAWNDNELADDVATLSYESALRTHARYRAADPTEGRQTQSVPASRDQVNSYELAPEDTAPAASRFAGPRSGAAPGSGFSGRTATPLERSLKSASVTIRMSKEESAQLHRRAAEAGLTVSAYLRSCTFEAESLRAMVKDTMAQLKAATSASSKATSVSARASLGERLSRFFTPWRATRRMAQA